MLHSLFWQLSVFFVVSHGKIHFSIPDPCFVEEQIEVTWLRDRDDPVNFFVQKENPAESADVADVRLGQDGPLSGIIHFTFHSTGPHRIEAVDARNPSRILATSGTFDVKVAPTPSVTLSIPPFTSQGPGATNSAVQLTPSSSPSESSNPPSSTITPMSIPVNSSKQSERSQAPIIIGTITALFIILLLVGIGLYLRRRRRRRRTAVNFNRDMMVRSTMHTQASPISVYRSGDDKPPFRTSRGSSLELQYEGTRREWGDETKEGMEESSLGHSSFSMPTISYVH